MAWAGICQIRCSRLAEWLRSNPMGDPFSMVAPMVRLDYDGGLFRWPLVPDKDEQGQPERMKPARK